MLRKVEFYKHHLGAQDKQALLGVLDSLFLTTGTVVKEFEDKFADAMGSKHAVGVMSCTHALELALRYFGIGVGDEVITSPLSFVATANSIEHTGARPVFVDVEPATGNIDVHKIEAAITPRTRAIMPVHMYGQMCDMIVLRALADKHNLKLIEDCAHCVEGERDGVRPGQLSDAACFSFYATKNLACGEGGALTCNDEEMYAWLLQARLHGMTRGAADRYAKKYQHYDVDILGMKCNMTNMQAALLVNQLDLLEGYLQRREQICAQYDEHFANLKLQTPVVLNGVKHARHLYTILVVPEKRDAIMHALQERGIGVAVNFRPIHLLSYYRTKYGYVAGQYPAAEHIGASTITLPLYARLSDDEVAYVIDAVRSVVGGEADAKTI